MKRLLFAFRFLILAGLGLTFLSFNSSLKTHGYSKPVHYSKPFADTGSIYIQLSNLTACPLAVYLKSADIIIGSFSMDANQTILKSFSGIQNFSKSSFNVSVITTNRNLCGEKQKFNALMGPPVDAIGWGYPFTQKNSLPTWQLQLFAHIYPDAVGPFGMYYNSVDFSIPAK